MWPIAADVAPFRLCVSVLGAPVNRAKTDEPIKMPFGMYILARPGEPCGGCTLAPRDEYE